ncbi:hypothetical protein GCM10009425_40730 [Pseudomonas asuensis]|uniref:Uncharacterized protein n=2 Tax=Pseudomonas asuensis TaxID=1825787 RepID=A0ABQ2H2T9_9PSED|nr:hypothetical protein GCM10009425_40730 [Pseudomonas asuensis]
MFIAAVWFVNQLMPEDVAFAIVGSILYAGNVTASWLDNNQIFAIAMLVASQIIVIPLGIFIAKLWVHRKRSKN